MTTLFKRLKPPPLRKHHCRMYLKNKLQWMACHHSKEKKITITKLKLEVDVSKLHSLANSFLIYFVVKHKSINLVTVKCLVTTNWKSLHWSLLLHVPICRKAKNWDCVRKFLENFRHIKCRTYMCCCTCWGFSKRRRNALKIANFPCCR